MPTYSIEPNERVRFVVRHEDADLLVLDKPPGVVTQPGLGHERDSLMNGLFLRWGGELQNLGKARDFGLLHRLDRETSGLVLVARRASAYDALRDDFARRRVRKFYWALVAGAPASPSGVIRKPILEAREGRGDGRKLAKISRAGKPAVTAYRVVSAAPHAALLECRPVTGRLHQVRVHLEAIGLPILGDDVYAPPAVGKAARRLALHAHRLLFTHPTRGGLLDVRSPWPADLRRLLKREGLPRPDSAAPGAVERAHEIAGDAIGQEDPAVGEDPAGA